MRLSGVISLILKLGVTYPCSKLKKIDLVSEKSNSYSLIKKSIPSSMIVVLSLSKFLIINK